MFHLRATISQFTSTFAFYTLLVQHIWSTFKCQAWGHEVKQGIVQTQWTDGCGKGATKQTVQWGQHCGHRSTWITKPCGHRRRPHLSGPGLVPEGGPSINWRVSRSSIRGWHRHKVPSLFLMESTEEPESPAFIFPPAWALAPSQNVCGPHLEHHSPGWARPENLHL